MDRIALGSQLRTLRTARGLTLRAAGEATHFTHGYIEALEKGRPNANPTLDALEAIATGLGGRLSVTLMDESDDVDVRVRLLGPAEKKQLAIVVDALVCAREDVGMNVVIDSVLGMIAARLEQAKRAG